MADAVYWVGSDGNVWLKGDPAVNGGATTNVGPSNGTGLSSSGANWNLSSGGFESNSLNQSIQAQQIADPNAPATSGSGTSSGGTSSGSTSTGTTIDPAVAALLGGQISNVNTQIAGLNPALQTDLSNIASQFNQNTNRENQSFQDATDQYNTQKGNTIQDLLSAKGNIANNVRSTTQALQTLLGLAGSGTSSASEIAAPFAASRAGGQQEQGVQLTYGRNLQGLDTAFNSSQRQHQNNITDLGNQQFQANQKAQGDINSTRQSLLGTLASLTSQQDAARGMSLSQAQANTAPILAQIQALLGQQNQYNSAYPSAINLANPTSYTAPSLGSYNFGSIGAPTSQPSTAATAQNAPLVLPALAQKDQNKLPAVG